MPFPRLFAILLITTFASGCATTGSSTAGQKQRPSLKIVEAPGHAEFSHGMRGVFMETLEDELFTRGHLKRGDEVTLEYRVVEADKGSRALRYVVGFGAGAGEIDISARLLNARGEVIASTLAEGRQVMGFGGGSFDTAIEDVAIEIADFVLEKL